MNKVLAIALLDIRRLGFGLVSGALIAGLIPALASGLGAKASVPALVTVAFLVVGAVTGGTFGTDFTDGKSSFFFARPLGAGALIAGRFAALLTLAAAAFFSFMASWWISTSDRSTWTLSVLARSHVEALLSAWAVALFVSLAAAARGRGVRVEGGLRALLMIPVRLALSMGAFLLVFGLFADLVLRAYSNDFTPIKVFGLSWVAASFVASCAAIAGGRTERGRIQRFQSRVMTAHFALLSLAVATAWVYVLHPGPETIQAVRYPTWGSGDGSAAFVSAKVDRGRAFRPIFILDIASGQARRLNADPFAGPWLSANGATMVWSEATPFFFRPLWRRMGGATTFRVRTASGKVEALPMPSKAPDYTSVRELSFDGAINWVLPSPDGDVFAIQWGRHLTFTSRSRGELSDLDDSKQSLGISRDVNLREAVFLPSGELRATRVIRDAAGAQSLTFIDIEPNSGSVRNVASIPVSGTIFVRFDGKAGRALLTSTTQPRVGAFVALLDLNGGADPRPLVLSKNVFFPSAMFLADGRIAEVTGSPLGEPNLRALKIFSPAGELLRDIPIGEGMPPLLGREMFPGIVALSTSRFNEEFSLIDMTSGAVVRRLSNLITPPWAFLSMAPPGTPAARLLQSNDGRLYELPSVDAEPRLLLPLPR